MNDSITHKITDQHIDELFQFTRKHFVEWYDLQCELVDHLANDIEQIWAENPSLTFEEAKMQSFKKFGIFGFSDIIERKSKALYKVYLKMMWTAFKDFFGWPKIVLTIMTFILTLNIIQWSNHNPFVVWGMFIVALVIPGFIGVKYSRKVKRKQKQTGKKWLFEEQINASFMALNLINILFQIGSNAFRLNISQWSYRTDIIVSAVFVLVLVLFIVLFVILPPKISRAIAEKHPEYELV